MFFLRCDSREGWDVGQLNYVVLSAWRRLLAAGVGCHWTAVLWVAPSAPSVAPDPPAEPVPIQSPTAPLRPAAHGCPVRVGQPRGRADGTPDRPRSWWLLSSRRHAPPKPFARAAARQRSRSLPVALGAGTVVVQWLAAVGLDPCAWRRRRSGWGRQQRGPAAAAAAVGQRLRSTTKRARRREQLLQPPHRLRRRHRGLGRSSTTGPARWRRWRKGHGDCEDFAIAKYFSLLALGMPMAQLRLVYVRAQLGWPPTRRRTWCWRYYAQPAPSR